jgi:nucleotide-binding universal stress UspA family protein
MTYKRILVPVDGSRTATAGLREAIRLAKGQGARLQLVHVVDQHTTVMLGVEAAYYIEEMMQSARKSGQRLLARAVAQATKSGLQASGVLLETLAGPAADPIVRQARKWDADLIVIGTHGRRGVRRMVMGSDAEQVVRSSSVPVMLVRARG